jgi:hypothetical protein
MSYGERDEYNARHKESEIAASKMMHMSGKIEQLETEM